VERCAASLLMPHASRGRVHQRITTVLSFVLVYKVVFARDLQASQTEQGCIELARYDRTNRMLQWHLCPLRRSTQRMRPQRGTQIHYSRTTTMLHYLPCRISRYTPTGCAGGTQFLPKYTLLPTSHPGTCAAVRHASIHIGIPRSKTLLSCTHNKPAPRASAE